jgi:hypothetical protein
MRDIAASAVTSAGDSPVPVVSTRVAKIAGMTATAANVSEIPRAASRGARA